MTDLSGSAGIVRPRIRTLPRLIRDAAGAGAPLDAGLRRSLEHSLDADLSAVRVHTGPRADGLARALGATALTSGADIFFRDGAFAPGEAGGFRLLAHEAAHVVQQARGAVGGRAVGGMSLSSPGDPWERGADAAADLAVAGLRAAERCAAPLPGALRSPRPGPSPLVVQRHVSYEHRLLGDVQTQDWAAFFSGHGPDRAAFLSAQTNLLWQWHQNPESVTEATVDSLNLGIRTLRLGPGNLLVTYGELNALPDYFPNAVAFDAVPANVMLPILQFIRQQGYNELAKLNGSSSPAQFAGAVLPAGATTYGFAALAEVQALEALTARLGIHGSNHYDGMLARNACHFAPFTWYRWQASHLIARDLATKAYAASGSEQRRLTRQAWIYGGYADHFLQDSFAAGHLVNKTLVMQWFLQWAALNNTDIADWDLIKQMTRALQPNLAGLQLYDRSSSGPSNDPQTAEEHQTFTQRMTATGIQAVGSTSQPAAYQNYLAFLASAVTQLAMGTVHDHYNDNSLTISSPDYRSRHGQTASYKVWGDSTLLSGDDGANGVYEASLAVQASQNALLELMSGNSSAPATAEILKYFPDQVVDGTNTLVDLQTWATSTDLFNTCQHIWGVEDSTEGLGAGVAAPRLGIVSRDQDFANAWESSLPDTGAHPVNTLFFGERLFAGSDGYVLELDPRTGQPLHQPLDGSLELSQAIGVDTRLAADGTNLYVGVNGSVYAVTLNGPNAWTKTWPPNYECSLPGLDPVSVLYVTRRLFAGSNGSVYEINPADGTVLHSLGLGSGIAGDTRLASDGTNLYAGVSGHVFRLSLDGSWPKKAWQWNLKADGDDAGTNLVNVLIDAATGRLFAGSDGYVFELDPTDEQKVLRHKELSSGSGVEVRLTCDGTNLYAGVYGFVYALSLAAGNTWGQYAWPDQRGCELADAGYHEVSVLLLGAGWSRPRTGTSTRSTRPTGRCCTARWSSVRVWGSTRGYQATGRTCTSV